MPPAALNRMQIRDYPIVLWIVGGIFMAVGVWMGFKREAMWISTLFFIIGALVALVLGSITTVIADKEAGTVTLRNRTVFRNVIKEYAISEINSVEVEHSRDNDGGTTYRVALLTTSGESVPFHSYYTSGYTGKEAQAKKLRDFLGLIASAAAPDSAAQVLRQALTPAFQTDQEGITQGVPWRVERGGLGSAEITRWSSPAFQMASGFLFVVQIPKGTKFFSGSKLLSPISRALYEQVLKVYGFPSETTPGLEQANPLEPPEARLKPNFATLASDPYTARQVLSPWAVIPLVQWAEAHPLKTVQASGTLGQLAVLFSPQGTTLACLGALTVEQTDVLASLGIELVKAQGG